MKSGTNAAARIIFPVVLSLIALILVIKLGALPPQGGIAAGLPVKAPQAQAAASVEPPFPITPPILELITASEPDFEGFSELTGAPGAVPADAAVIVINLSAHNLITTTADTAGAFTASLYAPAGSTLLIKYETDGNRIEAFWQAAVSAIADATTENLNPLPGTTLLVHPPPAGDGQVQEFATVGAALGDEVKGWSGWVLTGTLEVPAGGTPPGLRSQPGETITLTAHLRVTTPGVDCSEPVTFTINGSVHLRYLFNNQGTAAPWGMWFNAFLFTPTGLPIEHESAGEWPHLRFDSFTDLHCTGPHTFDGLWQQPLTIPMGLAEGIYRPEMILFGLPPLSTDVPMAVVWFHQEPFAQFPSILIGDPAPPQIPWTLLANDLVNGHRGLQAREDEGAYAMPTRVLYPPHHVVIPRLDERTGEPLVYRLEPGSLWVSGTDRRLPPPPHIPLLFPSGELIVEVLKPDGSIDQLGPVPIQQSSIRTPTTPGGTEFAVGTGHIGDLFNLSTMDDAFAYSFDQYGTHTIIVNGFVEDINGLGYELGSTYDVTVARILDLDPGQLPTTPYEQGDYFSPGLHVFPPVPADVHIEVTHFPFSDPAAAITTTFAGQANRYGYFQPPAGDPDFIFEAPGEYRVDYTASYRATDGTLWMGTVTWGNVVEGTGIHSPNIAAHGRRGMDYKSDTIDDMPIWFRVQDLPVDKIGIEMYYPYFSGDIHWGNEIPDPPDTADSIHSILTLEDLTGPSETIYNLLRSHFPRARNCYRWPPVTCSASGLDARLAIDEAPLFITTRSGIDPAVEPGDIDLWGYWYGSSERPDVHVREIISEDNMGTAYWRFNDTYGYQIGESADGDLPGDIKWEFGGVVLRTITDTNPLNEYAIYSSLWVLLPHGCDAYGCTRVTPPFQDATGASINGGPIMTLLGEDIDMLFLPKGVRPGDILELGDTFSFSGHVGPPLDSRVSITVTTPSQNVISGMWHANKIGWLYDPAFDFPVEEPGRWTVEVAVLHDRPYAGNGVIPQSHNTGTVLGTQVYNDTYEFYVVSPDSPRLTITAPQPGFITWPIAEVEPIAIEGLAPPGTTAVHYTIHDKGMVMGQGTITPDSGGAFSFIYDARALHEDFPMLSLTAREGRWEGLADEVAINLLAVGDGEPVADTVTLIGEEVFIGWDGVPGAFLPLIRR